MRKFISTLMLAVPFLLGIAGCVPVAGAAEASSTPALPATVAAPAAGTPVVITASGFATSGPAVTSQPGEPPSTPVSPTLAPPGSALTVTLQNNRQTLSMHAGDRFVLSLGDSFTWTVNVSDQSVLSRVVNITPLKGSQGVYEAHKPGSVSLEATGDPLCRQAKPACGMPSILFMLNVNVVP